MSADTIASFPVDQAAMTPEDKSDAITCQQRSVFRHCYPYRYYWLAGFSLPFAFLAVRYTAGSFVVPAPYIRKMYGLPYEPVYVLRNYQAHCCKDKVVVVLGGNGDFWQNKQGFIDRITARTDAGLVIALNYPVANSENQLIGHLKREINQVLKTNGLKPGKLHFIWYGHSLGAAASVALAETYARSRHAFFLDRTFASLDRVGRNLFGCLAPPLLRLFGWQMNTADKLLQVDAGKVAIAYAPNDEVIANTGDAQLRGGGNTLLRLPQNTGHMDNILSIITDPVAEKKLSDEFYDFVNSQQSTVNSKTQSPAERSIG